MLTAMLVGYFLIVAIPAENWNQMDAERQLHLVEYVTMKWMDAHGAESVLVNVIITPTETQIYAKRVKVRC